MSTESGRSIGHTLFRILETVYELDRRRDLKSNANVMILACKAFSDRPNIFKLLQIFRGEVELSTTDLHRFVSRINWRAKQHSLARITIEQILTNNCSLSDLEHLRFVRFVPDRVRLLIATRCQESVSDFFVEYGGIEQFVAWYHNTRATPLCPAAVARKLGVPNQELAKPLDWEEHLLLAFCQQSRNQPKDKRYCHLDRIALALGKATHDKIGVLPITWLV